MTPDVFGALANPIRRDLLGLLREGPKPVKVLAARFEVGRPAISEHLKVLLDAGLVTEEPRGRERYYHLDATPLRAVGEWLGAYERFWKSKLLDLATLLDTPLPDEDLPMKNTATIKADQLLPHPPARVWRALTDPALLGRWLMQNDFQPVVGHTFTLDTGAWGATHCEVLALEPTSLLRISWKNPPLDTTVTWRLVPEGAGTRLYVEHAGFDLDDPRQRFAFDGMSGGWGGQIAPRLAEVLDSLAADSKQ